jgi:MoaA/NifB/PqqE/SkfB family radical SAM enzyme
MTQTNADAPRASETTARSARLGRLQEWLARDPELRTRYDKWRRHASGIVASNYDIARRCNLRCEGCLFFEGTDYRAHPDDKTEAEWEAFFAAERQRGVNFVYLGGAEPALKPRRLKLAAKCIPRGVIFTNGTMPIDRSLSYTLHVSIWGTEEQTDGLRGGKQSFHKAFRNFGADPRARFIYTVNSRNLPGARRVAAICADLGASLSFSLFSPTELYRSKLNLGTAQDRLYFRSSSPEDHLAFSEQGLLDVRQALDEIIATFPRTVIYTHAYNRWVTDPGGLYRIDPESGWATDCEVRRAAHHRHVHSDLTSANSKCCSPNFDCRHCRAYAIATGTAVSRFKRFLGSEAQFKDWVDMAEQWARLFFHDWEALV